MIITLVQFKLPKPVSVEEASKLSEGSAHLYRDMPGLIRKHYVLTEDGSAPQVTYFESPVSVDNVAGKILTSAGSPSLAPKETKYDYVAIREVFADVGDGAPLVTVDLRPGREAERKAAPAAAIADALGEIAGIKPEDVYVLFRENPAENHYCGGKPLAGWVPADG